MADTLEFAGQYPLWFEDWEADTKLICFGFIDDVDLFSALRDICVTHGADSAALHGRVDDAPCYAFKIPSEQFNNCYAVLASHSA